MCGAREVGDSLRTQLAAAAGGWDGQRAAAARGAACSAHQAAACRSGPPLLSPRPRTGRLTRGISIGRMELDNDVGRLCRLLHARHLCGAVVLRRHGAWEHKNELRSF